jgi:hypothetical protein
MRYGSTSIMEHETLWYPSICSQGTHIDVLCDLLHGVLIEAHRVNGPQPRVRSLLGQLGSLAPIAVT